MKSRYGRHEHSFTGELLRHLRYLFLAFFILPAMAQDSSSDCSPLPDAPSTAILQLSEVSAAPLPDASHVATLQATGTPDSTSQDVPSQTSKETDKNPHSTVDPRQQQPKRILGFMPNYRAVSAGEIPPPPSARQAFMLATVNSFDYSSIVFGGLTSLLAEGTNTHPDLGKGLPGYWGYYWRGFIDKTDGNYMVVFAMPALLHEDVRYYALGHGGFKRRILYAASSVLIARNYQGEKTFSGAEVFGRGFAQAASMLYYPDQDNTIGALLARYGYSIGRDAITASFREFWPDIATHVLHRHP